MAETSQQTHRFDTLTLRWLPLALGWARRLGGPECDIHELAAQVLLRAMWSWRDRDDDEARAAWLFARVRRGVGRARWEGEGAEGVVGGLRPRLRALWVLSWAEGLCPEDVALLTGVNEATQATRLLGSARMSPLVERPNNLTVSTAIAFRF